MNATTKKQIRAGQLLGNYYAAEAELQNVISSLEEIRETASCECCDRAYSNGDVLSRADLNRVERAKRMILRALTVKH